MTFKLCLRATTVARVHFLILTVLSLGLLALTPAQAQAADLCYDAPTKRVYTKLEHTGSFLEFKAPETLFRYPWDENIPKDKKTADLVGRKVMQVQVVPDNYSKRMHWTIVMSPGGIKWMNPWIWFTVQDNVRITTNINVQYFLNVENISYSMNRDSTSVPVDQWEGWENNHQFKVMEAFHKGSLSSTRNLTQVGGIWPNNVAQYLVDFDFYTRTLGKNHYYPISTNPSQNMINNTRVGDVFWFNGGGAGPGASSGTEQAYKITFSTTMPENETDPVSVFGGIRSYQNFSLYYSTQQYKAVSEPLNAQGKSVVYSLSQMPYGSKDQNFDYGTLGGLPKDELYQSPFSELAKAGMKSLTQEQLDTIEWLLYLGYPFDNSNELGGYMIMAAQASEEAKVALLKRYREDEVSVENYPAPIRDYYRMTQEAIWKVIDPAFKFSDPTYPYELVDEYWDVNTESWVKTVNQYNPTYKNAGPKLLELARAKLAQEGKLQDYLKRIGKDDLQAFLYDQSGDLDHDNTSGMFVKLDASCKDEPDSVHISFLNKDNSNQPLTSSSFKIYEGALTSDQVENIDELERQGKVKSLGTVVANNGKVDMGFLESFKLYTLVQVGTPSNGWFTKVKPLVLHTYPSSMVELHDAPPVINPKSVDPDFSDFDRLYTDESGDLMVKTFEANNASNLGYPVNAVSVERRYQDIPVPGRPGQYVKALSIQNAFTLINNKLEPGIIGRIHMGEDVADLDLATQQGSKLKEEIPFLMFAKKPVSADLFFKGLDPQETYVVASRLYKKTARGTEKVGDVVHTTLGPKDLKPISPATVNGSYTTKDLAALNSYAENKMINLEFGEHELEEGEYIVSAILLKEFSYKRMPADTVERLIDYKAIQAGSSSVIKSPKEFPSLTAEVKVLAIAPTGIAIDSPSFTVPALAVGVASAVVAAGAWLIRRRMRVS